MSATSPTFGEIRLQCEKRFPGIDPDVRDSLINERYRRILRRGDWQRLRVQAVIQTAAPYETGTVEVTEGSASITGTGTVWTSGMSGRAIRINARQEYYQFTYVSGTTATLDRAYEGDTDADAAYSIWQNVYTLPADLSVLHSMRVFSALRDLDQKTQEQLDERDPTREQEGEPDCYALHMDDLSSPPRQQVELIPVPDDVYPIPFWYTQDPTLFSASQTSSFLAPWLNPAAIYDGVGADVARLNGNLAAAQDYETMFLAHLSEMFGAEARRRGARPLKIAEKYTRHNLRRWNR